MSTPSASPVDERSCVVVDLIGDLDATLGSIFAETLVSLVAGGATDVFVSARHVATSSSAGLATLDAACSAARRCGTRIDLDPGNRRMKAAFATISRSGERQHRSHPRGARHYMIARHARGSHVA